jgi:hypothetical protein
MRTCRQRGDAEAEIEVRYHKQEGRPGCKADLIFVVLVGSSKSKSKSEVGSRLAVVERD